MPAKKQTLANAILNAVLRGATYTGPSTVYLALCTTTPTATTAGLEVSGGGYSRMAVTFAPAASGATSNTGAVTFPAALAPWGNVVGAALFTAATGGEALYFGPLSTFKVVDIGDQITFAAGALSVTEA